MSDFLYKDWLKIKRRYKELYDQDYFNIVGIKAGVITEGEGLNYAVYFQGCPQNCNGCRNVSERNLKANNLWKTENLFQLIKDNIYFDIGGEDFNVYMEKRWLLYLEYHLMEMREFSLLKNHLSGVSYYTFMRVFQLKKTLLHRLLHSGEYSFSNDSLIDLVVNQVKIKKSPTRIRLSGITFGGGEPMIQAKNLGYLVERIKKELKLEIWVYSGFLFDDLWQYPEPRQVLNYTDFLVEGPFDRKRLNLTHPIYGSMNQNIIDVPKTIRGKKRVLWKPRFKWSRLFTPYWNRYRDIKEIEKYTVFKSKEDMEFYLKHKFKIKYKINTLKEYEEVFGSIRQNFLRNVLKG